MKILLSGATGFLGSEVLRQALARHDVARVTVVTRRPTGVRHAKLREVVPDDFTDYARLALSDHDAAIWCLGTSQVGADETGYVRVMQDYPLAAAKALFAANPLARFCFVSAASADPLEKSRSLYPRTKGRTERLLRELGHDVVVFRPGYIQPTRDSVPRRDAGRFFVPIARLINLFTDKACVDCDLLARSLLDASRPGAACEPVVSNSALRHWLERR